MVASGGGRHSHHEIATLYGKPQRGLAVLERDSNDKETTVKKLIAPFALAVALTAAAFPVLAAEGGNSPAKVTGWIVDDWCRQGNASAEGKECSLDCHKQGAALVLYEPKTERVYKLDNQEEAAKHVGHVTVTGQIEGDSLKVAKIEPARQAR